MRLYGKLVVPVVAAGTSVVQCLRMLALLTVAFTAHCSSGHLPDPMGAPYSRPSMSTPRLDQHQSQIDALIAAALAAAAPGPSLLAAWTSAASTIPDRGFGLVAVGKASISMARALVDQGNVRPAFGVIITPPDLDTAGLAALPNVQVLIADHPLPTERSLAAGHAALSVANRCRLDRLPLVVLLSGGTSSLMCLPQPGLELEDLRKLTNAMLRAGATIDQLNTIRAHCDSTKAGNLALTASPSPVQAYILSDVIGDKLHIIGSGPTVAPVATAIDALAILKKLRLTRSCSTIAAHLRLAAANPVIHDPSLWSHTRATIIANNLSAIDAAATEARSLGFEIGEIKTGIDGEARDAAFAFVGAIRRARARSSGPPTAVIWGGETTVRIRTPAKGASRGKGRASKTTEVQTARGGRNQEAALAAAIAIDGDPSIIIATFATDGIDGPTTAAGATVDGRTAAEARQSGLDPEDCLLANDSNTFFAKRAGLITTGPTGTNVNDLWIGLAY